jgi:SAM-dependent methyltransferase
MPKPNLVVDLGCGTGLSTRCWADRAASVIGIDASADMLRYARAVTTSSSVRYLEKLAHYTGLPDRCADVVTCGMSLHWMDPEATAIEIRRILRCGGVFGTYWYHWLTPFWEVELAYRDLMKRVNELDAEHSTSAELKRWPKRQQENTLASSGMFRLTKEISLHHVEVLDAEYIAETVKTLGAVMLLLKHGLAEAEVGLEAFRKIVCEKFGTQKHRVYHTWGLWLGVV